MFFYGNSLQEEIKENLLKNSNYYISIEEAMQQKIHKGFLNYFSVLVVMSQTLKYVGINAVIEKKSSK